MAKDSKTKKREASVPGRDPDLRGKVKNVLDDASVPPAKKRKATEDAAPVKTKKSKTPADSSTTGDLIPLPSKKTKTPKSTINGASDSKLEKKTESSDKPAEKKGAKAAKASDEPLKTASKGTSQPEVFKKDKVILKRHKDTQQKVEAKTEDKQTEDKDDFESDEDFDDEIDDQTAALLKGFESDGDEEDDKIEEGYKEGAPIPTIDNNKELSKKKQAKLKRAAAFPGQGKPGVVYVGRIPHGFYENEMRAYFKQFGNILNLRLSRNKRTGASRHYAFIQFESATVADIVAKTMDNYLMFGHILKVKFVPEEQVPADVFKGANKRFKKVPWNKMEGRRLEQGASEKVWDERAVKEQKRRDEKAEKLKAIGYEFDAPKIKSAKSVSKKEKAATELGGDEGGMKAIEAAPVVEESSEHKKKKKKSKAAKQAQDAVAVEHTSKPEKQEEKSIDTKHSKEVVEISIDTLITETAEKSKKKGKKDNKKKKEVVISELSIKKVAVKPVEAAPTSELSSEPKKDKGKKRAKVIAE